MSEINILSVHPLQNATVLRNLAKYVNCPVTLQSCKIVSWEWRKQFNKTSTFHSLGKIICPSPNGLGYNRIHHAFDPVVTIFKIERLRVQDCEEILKNDDVMDFLKIKGRFLKYLSLETVTIELATRVHFEFLGTVFQHCLELEELRLIGLLKEKMETDYSSYIENDIPIKKIDYGKTGFSHKKIPLGVFLSIIQFSKKLDSFVINGFGYDMDPNSFQIITLLMKHISKHSRKLTTLKLINISVNHETFRVLVSAGLPLSRIVFSGYLQDANSAYYLNLFIESYSASLKYIRVDTHYYCMQNPKQIELNVHAVTNLEVLEIDTKNIIISGQIGNLVNLHHLTLSGKDTRLDTVTDIDAMFGKKKSISLRSVRLNMRPDCNDVARLLEMCPNVTNLEVSCFVGKLREFVSALRVSEESCLKDLTIKLYFFKSDIYQYDWSLELFRGLSSRLLQTFKIRAFSLNFYPWLRGQWIQEGLACNQNMFYFIGFECFNICADEIATIIRTLVGRASFVNFTECNIVNTKTNENIHFKHLQIFEANLEDVILDISKRIDVVT